MELQARFNFTKVNHTQTNRVHLVASITAPVIDWVSQRPKICILPVIDNSGSMQGPKLQYAKASVEKLIEQLAPGDYAGLITFESKVDILVEPAEVTADHKAKLLSALRRIQPAGGTNFSDAILESIRRVERLDLPANFINRVIFFTDGQPNAGISDPAVLKKILGDSRGRVSMSFFGYGSTNGGCDQDLLGDLAKIGDGNYAYVQNPDDALSAFGRELGGLLSTYASDLRLIVQPKGGHSITKVITDLKYEEDSGGELIFSLGDILGEETRHVVFEMELQEQNKAFPRETAVVSLKATCMKMTQTAHKEPCTVDASAKVQFVRPGDAQITAAHDVDEIVATHQLVRSQLDAEALANKGNYSGAQQVLRSMSLNFNDRGLGGLSAVAGAGVSKFADQNAYATSDGYRASMKTGMLRSSRLVSSDAEVRVALNALSTGASTAQETYAASFSAPVPVPVPPAAPESSPPQWPRPGRGNPLR